MNPINNIQLNRNFWLKEFECPCCHLVMLHPSLLKLAIRLRNQIKEPLIINSGYRCQVENKKVGGVPHSYHRIGMAIDVYSRNVKISDLASYAMAIGFNGVGIYGTFIHLDIRPHKYYWEG